MHPHRVGENRLDHVTVGAGDPQSATVFSAVDTVELPYRPHRPRLHPGQPLTVRKYRRRRLLLHGTPQWLLEEFTDGPISPAAVVHLDQIIDDHLRY